MRERRRGAAPEVARALSESELAELFAAVDGVFLPEAVARYVARLVAATLVACVSGPVGTLTWLIKRSIAPLMLPARRAPLHLRPCFLLTVRGPS